jgi:hypothetical protein
VWSRRVRRLVPPPDAEAGDFQDHLESIFAKTGIRSRSELVGQIFLEHYVPRWEDLAGSPAGWFAKASPIPAGSDPDLSPAPDPSRRSG